MPDSEVRYCRIHPDEPLVRGHDPFPTGLALVEARRQCRRCVETQAEADRARARRPTSHEVG